MDKFIKLTQTNDFETEDNNAVIINAKNIISVETVGRLGSYVYIAKPNNKGKLVEAIYPVNESVSEILELLK